MKTTKFILLLLAVGWAASSSADLLRFDFSGRTYLQPSNGDPVFDTGTYQGYFIIDPTVENTGQDPFFSIFDNSLVGGNIAIEGVVYTIASSGINRSGITNNAGASYDSFYVTANMVSQFGDEAQFAIQLVDSSNQIFGVDDLMSLPTLLTLDQFDPWSPELTVDTGTIGLLFQQGAPLMTVDSAYLRVVPVPGAWLLFASGLLLFKPRSD